MHLSAVLKLVSPVMTVIGLSMIACAFVSLYYTETPLPLLYGGVPALLFGLLGSIATRNVEADLVGVKEGCAVVSFAWIGACIFGAIPFYTMGWHDPALLTSWTKSFYEIVSGFTTTGSSIFTDVEILPRGILFWRSFTHWLGGMGIVVLAIAFLPKIGIGGMQAFRMEAPGPLKSDKLVPRISQTARILYTVYFAITIIEVLLLLAVGVGLFDSLLHTFGTVGTGGFSNYNASVAGLKNPAAEYIIAFFMWLSGANFALSYLFVVKRQWRIWLQDSEFKVYTAITLAAIGLITGALLANHYHAWDFSTAFRYAFFQVPTILTTTGYATSDFNQWPLSASIVLLGLMFIGGSTGSTGGGLKVLRHIISFKFIYHELRRIVRPHLVTSVRVSGRTIDSPTVNSVMALIVLYLFCFGIGTAVLVVFGLDFVSAFTGSIANLGNIGPGLNVVGPASNYSSLHPVSLWTLSFLMILGRLELYTFLVLFLPSTWRR